jgi:hypothetical protein
MRVKLNGQTIHNALAHRSVLVAVPETGASDALRAAALALHDKCEPSWCSALTLLILIVNSQRNPRTSAACRSHAAAF